MERERGFIVSMATPPTILLEPCDPRMFCSTDTVIVEDWLDMYEHISNQNRRFASAVNGPFATKFVV